MKKLMTISAVAISLSCFAQERIILTSDEVNVTSTEAILVRTAETPDIVRVKFNVPMSNSVCEAYSTRFVLVTSGAQCGYNEYVSGYTTRTICLRTNPQNGKCLRIETQRIPVIQRHPRTCQVPETYCSSYGTITNYETDEVKIKFKKLPELGGTEEDTFMVKARQKSYNGQNVIYEISSIQTVVPYTVKSKGLFGFDSYVIEVK
jgi:hypothetical protein